jgi:UvrD-like helicase C-terminal domain
MRVLTYADLAPGRLAPAVDAVLAAIERDDFRSADVKKLSPGSYYRAKLDAANRLLLTFVEHRGEKVCLALEIIEQHAYDRSRFLRGAAIDESKWVEPPVPAAAVETTPVRYLHPGRRDFRLLDKPISFDDVQEAVFRLKPPAIIVGSAGSGKTALALEKLRQIPGRVAYLTQSTFLADGSRTIYGAHGWDRDDQDADFLSLRALIESIEVPAGRAITFKDFRLWFERNRPAVKGADAHQVFEEIRGVLTSQPEGPLPREAYLGLGVKQSIFPAEARQAIYDHFERYQRMLADGSLFDPNLVAHRLLAKATPRYDFVVVDEVQDLTNVELSLVLHTLSSPGQFLLCGDSNQIVHPNFFSWAAVKSLFWRDAPALLPSGDSQVSVLEANYRNSRAVTRVANALLKIKHARFGSIDRESNHLVRAAGDEPGTVTVLPDDPKVLADLDARTRQSTEVAVLVLRDEHKEEARRVFHTPLLFSIHEAKGLEYENVILYQMTSSERAAYREVCDGVTVADLAVDELRYRRPRDKEDRSLEVYKFFVNALYVALTRAVKSLYLVERDRDHPLLRLLDVASSADASAISAKASTLEEWQREARKLELQGKREQADAIRAGILKTTPVPWKALDEPSLREVATKAFAPNSPSAKAKQTLYEFACVYGEPHLARRLAAQASFFPARSFAAQHEAVARKQTAPFAARNFKDVLWQTERYGVDYRTPANLTPLMLAAREGNVPLAEALLGRGARVDLVDAFGCAAVHHALARAYADPTFARDRLGPLYELLAPQHVDLLIDGQLVTLARHQGELFLWNAMTALARGSYDPRGRPGITSAQLTSGAFESFPGTVVKPLRKKREYVNGLLARHEIESHAPYNRKLWQRVRHAHYWPNLGASIRVVDSAGEERWETLGARLNQPLIEWLRGPPSF